jgi:hypothetical protein
MNNSPAWGNRELYGRLPKPLPCGIILSRDRSRLEAGCRQQRSRETYGGQGVSLGAFCAKVNVFRAHQASRFETRRRAPMEWHVQSTRGG